MIICNYSPTWICSLFWPSFVCIEWLHRSWRRLDTLLVRLLASLCRLNRCDRCECWLAPFGVAQSIKLLPFHQTICYVPFCGDDRGGVESVWIQNAIFWFASPASDGKYSLMRICYAVIFWWKKTTTTTTTTTTTSATTAVQTITNRAYGSPFFRRWETAGGNAKKTPKRWENKEQP